MNLSRGVAGGIPVTAANVAAGGHHILPGGVLAPPVPWYARPVGPSFSGGVFGEGALGLRGATAGSVLGAAAVGVGAGLGARDDYNSDTAGIAVGVGAAALSAFNPAALALIAAAEVLRFGVDEFYNKPAEANAENGIATQMSAEIAAKGQLSNEERAKEFDEKAKKLREEAANVKTGWEWDTGFFGADPQKKIDLEAEASSFSLQANSFRKRTATQQQWAADQERLDFLTDFRKNAALMQKGQDSGVISNGASQEGRVVGMSDNEDLSQTVTILLRPHAKTANVVNGIDRATR
ncbi:hypothetical protein EON80_19135 [bacterium]|nr:MAG: hypothetical protein EON80_19135 [bacterium]